MTRETNFCPTCGNTLRPLRHTGRERPYCDSCEMPYYIGTKVAVIVFISSDDKVLLTQRCFDPGKGKWALPGGFVDHDEAPKAAAIREVCEETGLDVHIRKLLTVIPKQDDGMADLVIAYGATVVAGQIRAGDDAAAVGWFSSDAMPPLVFYPCIALINLWRAGELDV